MPDAVFATVFSSEVEMRRSAVYRIANAGRENQLTLVIQRTLDGAGFYEDQAGRRLVGEGQAMLFTHREESSYGYPPEATEPYRLEFVAFGAGSLAPLFQRLRTDFGSVVKMPSNSEAAALFDRIARHHRQNTFRDRVEETELLHALLCALHREQVNDTQKTDPVEYGYHHLKNHFRTPLSLKDVAEICGVSREHFIRGFSARYGEPPATWLRKLRLEHARTLLAATRLNVQDVALASGFTSSNTFCRAFRDRYRTSPGAGRETAG